MLTLCLANWIAVVAHSVTTTTTTTKVTVNTATPRATTDVHKLTSVAIDTCALKEGLDFSSPLLRALTSHLAPTLLRIGGTDQNTYVYDMGNAGGYEECTCGHHPSHGVCKLSAGYWDSVLDYVNSTDVQLLFGLDPNEHYTKNATNGISLIEYTAKGKFSESVYAYSWGNEQTGDATLANDYLDKMTLVRAALNAAYPDAKSRPLLVGADTGVGPLGSSKDPPTSPVDPWKDPTVAEHLAWIKLFYSTCKGVIDALTWHTYDYRSQELGAADHHPLPFPPPANASKLWDPAYLATASVLSDNVTALVADVDAAAAAAAAADVPNNGTCAADIRNGSFWDHTKCSSSNGTGTNACCHTLWGIGSPEECCSNCKFGEFGIDCVAWEFAKRVPRASSSSEHDMEACYVCNSEVLPYRGAMEDHTTGVLETTSPTPKPTPVWLTETDSICHQGVWNVTNAYANSLWLTNRLGAFANRGVQVMGRQSLIGFNYSLLGNFPADPIYAAPDYYTTVLFRTLAADVVLTATTDTGDERLPIYAFCSREHVGGIVVLALNLKETTVASVDLSGILDSSSGGAEEETAVDDGRVEYLMTPLWENGAASDPARDKVTSRKIALNGAHLEVDYSTGALPAMKGKAKTVAEPMVLPPLTYGFSVFPTAKAKACV